MLVLTRKPGEALVIDGHDLVITILSVKGRKVRVGIKARDEVRIMRRELCEPSPPAVASRSH